MSCKARSLSGGKGVNRPFFRLSVTLLTAIIMGGCSSAFSRFDFPIFGLTDSKNDTGSVRPVPSEPVYGRYGPTTNYSNAGSYGSGGYGYGADHGYRDAPSYDRDYAPVERSESYSTNRSSLPPVSGFSSAPKKQRVASVNPARLTDQKPPTWSSPRDTASRSSSSTQETSNGRQITVRPGDTLYSLSRRHGTSVQALRAANNLSNNDISVGQRLYLTKARTVRSKIAKSRVRAKTYEVRPGDTIYSIARSHGIDQKSLARANEISDTGHISPGQTLTIPGGRSKTVQKRLRAKPTKIAVKTSQRTRVASLKNAPIPYPTSKPKQTLKPTPRKTRVASLRKLPKPTARSKSHFRWPVRGRVISSFGKKSKGVHNDGINIAVPFGTSVKAAENGVVAYAGNELKGYGNLILIRHSGNWVSAYAHNSKLLVQRGDKIQRGQIIAKAGKSGSVTQPQVHFELRKGSKPVNPISHMAGI